MPLPFPRRPTITRFDRNADGTRKGPNPYNYRWQREREQFLIEHPLCECALCDAGRLMVRASAVIDHKIPHRGDQRLFWDRSNWQALSKHCHDSWKKEKERSGVTTGCDEHGLPLDPDHPWARSLLLDSRPTTARDAASGSVGGGQKVFLLVT